MTDPPGDLLAGVQERIHQRSGGKFFRDRFARGPQRLGPMWIPLALLVVLAATWLAFSAHEVLP